MTSAQYPSVTAGIRALGRAGLSVLALAPRRSAAGIWSRYAAGGAVAPAPDLDPSGFVERISEIADKRGPVVVYPGCDDAIDAVLEHGAALPASVRLPYPPAGAAEIRDKRKLPQLADSSGLLTPRTVASASGLDLLGSGISFPCIVKPAREAGPRWRARTVGSAPELAAHLARGRLPRDGPLLAQEHLHGPLTSLEIVIAPDGSVARSFQQLASRTSPSAAGLIRSSISVRPDADLVARAARLLGEAGYWGLAQIDLIETAEGFAVLDVNPRFYSCLPLSLACGVNLPAVWHAVATGLPVPPSPREYEVGVGYRWLEGEMVEALRNRTRFRAMTGTRPQAGAIWARDDPVPSLALAIGSLGERLGGIAARVADRFGRAGDGLSLVL